MKSKTKRREQAYERLLESKYINSKACRKGLPQSEWAVKKEFALTELAKKMPGVTYP